MEKASAEGKPLTWDMVTAGLKLSKLQIRNILKSKGQSVPEPETQVDAATLMVLLVASLLDQLDFLEPEQRTLILDAMDGAMQVAVENKTLAQLAFSDRRYCLWTGNTGVLDLTTGDNLAAIPAMPVETISYNLNAVYLYGRIKIERRSGLHAQQQDSDGTMEKPADVRECATDSVP